MASLNLLKYRIIFSYERKSFFDMIGLVIKKQFVGVDFPRSRPWKRIHMQLVYLGNDDRKHW